MRRFAPLLVLLAACSGGDDDTSAPRDAGANTPPRDGGAGTGAIVIEPTSIDFGDVQFGGEASESIVLMNTGDATVTIREIGQGDMMDPSFSASTPRPTVPPGVSVGVVVTFRPAGVGMRETTLIVRTTAGDFDLPVRGVGLANPCRSSTTSISFGNVIQSSTVDIPFEVTNPNDVAITAFLAERDAVAPCIATGPIPDGFCVYAADRMIGDLGEFVVSANETVNLVARYTPATSTAPPDRGEFTIQCFGEDDGGPTVTLNGTGVSSGLRCPGSIEFGELFTGGCETTTATCSNIANADIVIGNWAFNPPMDPPYTVEPPQTVTLTPDDEVGIDITFCPVTDGTFDATLEVTTDQAEPDRVVGFVVSGSAVGD